jgi:hypothetical protein
VLETIFASTPQPSGNDAAISEYILLIIIFGLLIFRRLKRGIYGRPFSKRRVVMSPLIYGLLLLFFLTELYPHFFHIGIDAIIVIPGIILGLKVGILSKVYENNGILMYKRSSIILIITTVLYLGRIILELVISLVSVEVITIFNGLLAITLGILIGEAFHILRMANEYTPTTEK